MERTILILINGLPATGKTNLAQQIALQTRLPLICKDEIKELLFDCLGTHDRDWSRRLGVVSIKLMYFYLDKLLQAGQSAIIESVFDPDFAKKDIQKLKDKYDFQIVQVFLYADRAIIVERFKQRVHTGSRHKGHVDEANFEMLEEWELEPIDVPSELIKVDTTYFSQVNFDKLIAKIKSLLK